MTKTSKTIHSNNDGTGSITVNQTSSSGTISRTYDSRYSTIAQDQIRVRLKSETVTDRNGNSKTHRR